jgi:hypothetical protein
MSDESVSVQVGPGGVTILTIVFILLKVFGKIDWSWWWVFSPLWITFLLLVIIVTIMILIALWVAN